MLWQLWIKIIFLFVKSSSVIYDREAIYNVKNGFYLCLDNDSEFISYITINSEYHKDRLLMTISQLTDWFNFLVPFCSECMYICTYFKCIYVYNLHLHKEILFSIILRYFIVSYFKNLKQNIKLLWKNGHYHEIITHCNYNKLQQILTHYLTFRLHHLLAKGYILKAYSLFKSIF